MFLHSDDDTATPRKRAPGFKLRPNCDPLAAGDRLLLRAQLLGHPPPKITWLKDGVEVTSNDRIRVYQEDKIHCLEIESVGSGDAGRYSIVAKNGLGRQIHNVMVKVGDAVGNAHAEFKAETLGELKFSMKKDPLAATPSIPSVHYSPKSVPPPKTRKTYQPVEVAKVELAKPAPVKHEPTPSDTNSETEADQNTLDVKDEPDSAIEPEVVVSLVIDDISQHTSASDTKYTEVSDLENINLELHHSTSSADSTDHTELSDEESPEPSLPPSVEPVTEIEHASEPDVYVSDDIPAEIGNGPTLIKALSDMEAELDDYVMLQCEFEDADDIVWNLNGLDLPPGTVVRQIGPLSKIRIRNVTKDDYGTYTAIATNPRGSTETKCELRTIYLEESEAKISPDPGYATTSPPETTDEKVSSWKAVSSPPSLSSLDDQSFKEGDKLVLEVKISATGEFQVEWLCNDQIFQADADNLTIIEIEPTLSRLILDDVNEDDSGTYCVRVKNQDGMAEQHCNVTIDKAQAPPQFILVPDEVDCFLNESTVIQVQAQNVAKAFWLSDERVDAEVNGTDCVVKIQVTNETKPSGLFVISGPGGEIQRSIALNIQVQTKIPSFIERLHETTVEEGETISLSCVYDGVPQPTVEWFFNGATLDETGDTLTIQNCKLSQAGKYAVKISNEAGSDKSMAMVEVNKKPLPPKFLNSPSDRDYDRGCTVELQCFVGGCPEPKS